MVQWFKTFYFVNVAQPCAFTNIKELIRLVYLIQYWLHSNTCLVGKWGNTSLLACSESAIPVFFDSGILKWSEIILASELESYGCWRYKAGSMSGKDLSLNIVCSSSQIFAWICGIRCPWCCDQYCKFWQLQELDQEYIMLLAV